VVVTHALRTPIGRFLGTLADVPAVDLGVTVVRALLERARLDPGEVDELIFGHGRQAGSGPNPGRQVSVRAGIPVETPAWTLNMACASSLKALDLAVEGIRVGRTRVAVVGGMESMSRLPFFLPDMRRGYRLGHAPVVDAMYRDGFLCPLSDRIMGETAENLARLYSIPREEQDRFALESQHKCQAAREAGRFTDELVGVEVPRRKGQAVVFDSDEHARDDVKPDSLAKLPPVFDQEAGTVTAGNSSGITDGAAALLVMSEELAHERGLEPLAWVGEYTEAGVAPEVMGLGPVPAVRALRERNGLALGDYELIELNEAFAAQVLACHRELDLPMDRLNVNGGAIALGHPIGATGARIAVTLLHEMRRRSARHGLATLCVSGGLGLATAFERR